MNGFKFHTESYGSYRATDNTRVCIKGSVYNETESDYYGTLVKVIESEFEALPVKRTVLFKCESFDPTPHVGIVSILDINLSMCMIKNDSTSMKLLS